MKWKPILMTAITAILAVMLYNKYLAQYTKISA
jgi:hypothetical protein